MKIVILGLGETGFYLAQILLQEGHDLVLIDRDDKSVKRAQESLDAQIIQGDGASPLILEPVMDEKTDLVVAVTDRDETNIIGTLIARKYGVKRAIARVSNSDNLIHPLLTDDPSVSLLNPEMIVAKDLIRLVGNPSADEIELFANGRAEMLKLDVLEGAAIAGKPLREVQIPNSWLFVATIRKGKFSIASGDSILQPGDHALVIGDPQKNSEIEKLLGLTPFKVKRVILIGYNDMSAKLAMSLVKRKVDVRLIEDDSERAEQAASNLDGVLVLHGDATNEQILEQAGIDQTDYLLAATDDDENNVLFSLLAKEKHVKRVITLTQKAHYKPLVQKIGIDSVVNPRSAMVDEIIRCIHHDDVSVVNILEGGKGRMLEIVIKKDSKLVGQPLSKIKLPKQTLIGSIIRDDKLIIPRGGDSMQLNDHIVVFTTRSVLSDVKKLFVG